MKKLSLEVSEDHHSLGLPSSTSTLSRTISSSFQLPPVLAIVPIEEQLPAMKEYDALFPDTIFGLFDAKIEKAFFLRYICKLYRIFVIVPPVTLTIEQIEKDCMWLLKMTQRCCFTLVSLLGGLDLMLKIKNLTGPAIPNPNFVLNANLNLPWKTLWVSCMILSEKIWEDNFVHPQHIINTFKSGISSRDFLAIQMTILFKLDYDIHMKEERYEELIKEIMNEPVPMSIAKIAQGNVFISRPLPRPSRMGCLCSPSFKHAIENDVGSYRSFHSKKQAWFHQRNFYYRLPAGFVLPLMPPLVGMENELKERNARIKRKGEYKHENNRTSAN